MPGPTALWTPEQYIEALRLRASVAGSYEDACVLEGAARLIWKLWTHANPADAADAKPRLFQREGQ